MEGGGKCMGGVVGKKTSVRKALLKKVCQVLHPPPTDLFSPNASMLSAKVQIHQLWVIEQGEENQQD
jgi:hypothetical protein